MVWSSSSDSDAPQAPQALQVHQTHQAPQTHQTHQTRQFDRAKLNVPLAETEVLLDDEPGIPLVAGKAVEESDDVPLDPAGARPTRSIAVLSSDEEEESLPANNTSPWSEQEDAKLRWLLESYQGMVDPWGVVAYDSFFVKARRSQRNVMQRAMELGLLDRNTELPEEDQPEESENGEMEKPGKQGKPEEGGSEEKEKEDKYSFEQRSEFIKTNLMHISQKVKVEKAVEMLEPLLCVLEREVMHRQELKQKGEERVGGKSEKMKLPPSVPVQMRGQVALLLRSLRLQPSEMEVIIPAEVTTRDFKQMLEVVESQMKRWKYQLNRKANKRVASEEEEEEEVTRKKRRVVVDDSD